MISMDHIISNAETQRCWAMGYDSIPGAGNPFDWQGDGNRAMAWEEGRDHAVEKSRNYGFSSDNDWENRL